MNEEYYCDDDYDQEYAEGYSAYKYDNKDYESGYEDAPEYAEEEDVDDCVDDDDCDVYHEEPVQERYKETPQTSDIAPHHILLGSIVAALGHAALKKSGTRHRQQQARQRPQHVAPKALMPQNGTRRLKGT